MLQAEKLYENHPELVTEEQEVTVLWNFIIHTDWHIKANRSDILIKDYKSKMPSHRCRNIR